jgi:DNA-binding IclR family transcriptional regulator
MNATRAEILQAINNEPAGITSAALAQKLGAPAYNVSSVLSKLAAYGEIRKGPGTRNRGSGYVWLPITCGQRT